MELDYLTLVTCARKGHTYLSDFDLALEDLFSSSFDVDLCF